MAHERDAELSGTGVPPPPPIAGTSRTNRNLWMAYVEEAKAHQTYIAYAMKAMQEGHPEVAEVFLEVSGAETAHALGHLQVLGEVGPTQENLQRVIEEEMLEASVMYPRMIRQAEAEGRADAAAAFRRAFQGETRHAGLFKQAYQRLQSEGQLVVPSRMVAVPPATTEPPASGAPSGSPGKEGPGAGMYEDLQGEKQRVAGLRRIREVVFGAQDGLISTLAIAATVMAATQQNQIALVAGLASAMAGTISMAAGTFLGARATTEMEQAELELERMEIIRHPDEERAELVATYRHDAYGMEEAEAMADRVMRDREGALRVMAERELGISPEVPPDPKKDAAVMGASYVVGGLVPLLPYLLVVGAVAIPVSIGVTLVALAGVGVMKARTAHRSVLPSILEVTGIGAASGALGYLLGDLFPRLFASL